MFVRPYKKLVLILVTFILMTKTSTKNIIYLLFTHFLKRYYKSQDFN